MKKFFQFTFLLSFILNYSQEKTEIQQLTQEIQNQKTEIKELLKKNIYYKETLNLLKPLQSNTADKLKFDIIKIIGNKNEKSLTVDYTIRNISDAERENYTPQNSYLVDPRGNAITTTDFKMTGKQKGIEHLQPNIPIKGSIIFKLEETDFQMIKLLNIKFSNLNRLKDGLYSTIHFENVPVAWY